MLGVFLDSEANGLNPRKHRLIEIAYQIIDLYTGKCLEKYQSAIFQPEEVWNNSDVNSLQVNGFTYNDVKQGKHPEKVAEEIIRQFNQFEIKRGKAVFICQNPSFDRIFFSQLIDGDIQENFQWPYHWLDFASMFWAYAMQKAKDQKSPYPWEVGLSKDRIAFSFKLPTEKKPHRAMNGVDHLVLCYRKMVGFPKESL